LAFGGEMVFGEGFIDSFEAIGSRGVGFVEVCEAAGSGGGFA